MTGEGNTEREREGIMAMAEKEGATITELEPRGDFPDATECIVVRPDGSFFYYYYHPERFLIKTALSNKKGHENEIVNLKPEEWVAEEIVVEYDSDGIRITSDFPDESTFMMHVDSTSGMVTFLSLALGRQFPQVISIEEIKEGGTAAAEKIFKLDSKLFHK